jgi:hypothetical protein
MKRAARSARRPGAEAMPGGRGLCSAAQPHRPPSNNVEWLIAAVVGDLSPEKSVGFSLFEPTFDRSLGPGEFFKFFGRLVLADPKNLKKGSGAPEGGAGRSIASQHIHSP